MNSLKRAYGYDLNAARDQNWCLTESGDVHSYTGDVQALTAMILINAARGEQLGLDAVAEMVRRKLGVRR
jgi:hypothetical protein